MKPNATPQAMTEAGIKPTLEEFCRPWQGDPRIEK